MTERAWEDTRFEMAIYVLRWLDRNGCADTNLREVMDLVGNYGYSLEKAIEKVRKYNEVMNNE
jgi:hypothetical protein